MAQARIATVIVQCPSWPGTKAFELRAADRQDAARSRQRRPFSPRQHDEYGGQQPQHQRQKRHDPCHPVETGAGRSGQHRGTVFLHEVLQRQIIVLAAIETRHEFAAHAIRISAAHVVAFQQNLAAAADAHQPVAQTVEARSFVTGAEEGEHGQGEQRRLKNARHGIGQRLHNFRFQILDFRLSIPSHCSSACRRSNLKSAIFNLKSPHSVSRPCRSGFDSRRSRHTHGQPHSESAPARVPPIMIRTPTQIHITSGFRWALMMGRAGRLVEPFVGQVEIFFDRRTNSGQGLRLLAGLVKAPLGIHGRRPVCRP